MKLYTLKDMYSLEMDQQDYMFCHFQVISLLQQGNKVNSEQIQCTTQ